MPWTEVMERHRFSAVPRRTWVEGKQTAMVRPEEEVVAETLTDAAATARARA